MSRTGIVQQDGQAGFYWTYDSKPISLPELVATQQASGEDPLRLIPTHLQALDDALIIAAGRFGELLGGGRRPDPAEAQQLVELHRALDRLVHEYAAAHEHLPLQPDVRGGQIVGTATLMSVMARQPVGLLGPAPLDGELDEPPLGVVSGYGDLLVVDAARPWAGARWVVRTTDDKRLPATLAMLLFDSSGVHKDEAVNEHRAALRRTTKAALTPEADPLAAACAIDWMLYDFLMAHRDGPDSGAVELNNRPDDALMVVRAADASVVCRSRVDPLLLRLPAVAPLR